MCPLELEANVQQLLDRDARWKRGVSKRNQARVSFSGTKLKRCIASCFLLLLNNRWCSRTKNQRFKMSGRYCLKRVNNVIGCIIDKLYFLFLQREVFETRDETLATDSFFSMFFGAVFALTLFLYMILYYLMCAVLLLFILLLDLLLFILRSKKETELTERWTAKSDSNVHRQ